MSHGVPFREFQFPPKTILPAVRHAPLGLLCNRSLNRSFNFGIKARERPVFQKD